MTTAEWRESIAELRELADKTSDPARRQRYLDLADRWEEFAEELEGLSGHRTAAGTAIARGLA
jgi:hypothetical protein